MEADTSKINMKRLFLGLLFWVSIGGEASERRKTYSRRGRSQQRRNLRRHTVVWDRMIDAEFSSGVKTLEVNIGDTIEIVCPTRSETWSKNRIGRRQSKTVRDNPNFSLYQLESHSQWRTCDTSQATKLIDCKDEKDGAGLKFTTKIQRRTAQADGLRFESNKTYYYLSIPTQPDIIEEETLSATIVTTNRLERDAQLPEPQELRPSRRKAEAGQGDSCSELKESDTRARSPRQISNLRLQLRVLPQARRDDKGRRARFGERGEEIGPRQVHATAARLTVDSPSSRAVYSPIFTTLLAVILWNLCAS